MLGTRPRQEFGGGKSVVGIVSTVGEGVAGDLDAVAGGDLLPEAQHSVVHDARARRAYPHTV